MAEEEAAQEEQSPRQMIADLMAGDGAEPEDTTPEPEAEPTEAQAAVESQEDGSSVTQEDLSDADATQEALEPPTSWTADEQTLFRNQPLEVQQAWLDRFGALEQEHEERSASVAPLQQAIEPYRGWMEQMGTTPELYVGQLLQTATALFSAATPNAQKQQMLLQLARDSGVDFGQPEPQQQDADSDPFGIGAMVQQHLGPLQQQIEQLTGHVGQQQQTWQQQTQQQVEAEIHQFVTEMDGEGNLLRPYANEVAETWTAIVNQERMAGNPRPDLQKTYEQACWSNESVREKMLSAEKHKAQQQQQQEVEKRRAASGGVTGGGGAASEKQLEPRDFIAAQLRKRRTA